LVGRRDAVYRRILDRDADLRPFARSRQNGRDCRVRRPSIGAELAPRQVVARIDRSLFLYPVGGRYDMLEWL
jgi:hypothetical protein